MIKKHFFANLKNHFKFLREEKYKNYLLDLISIIKKQAGEAKLEANNPKEERENYAQGALMGYYSIITLLKHEAFAFCIDQKELGLAEIKPDIDLLCSHSNSNRNPDIDYVEDNWAIDVMTEERVKGYLSDSIKLLKDQAMEAKKEADNPKEGFEGYNKGELMVYCSLFSLLKRQASVFNIDEKELGLVDIEPERDLI